MNDGYAPSGDDFLFYREAGSGELVLFIHAGVADSRMWMPQLDAVPDGFHFVAFDQRGFGRSELGTGPYEDLLDARAVMDYFSAEKAVVVGCSMGSSIAIQIAASAPERVSGLVLVGADSPGFEPSKPYESPEWPQAVAAFEAGDLGEVARLDAEMWLAGDGRSTEDVDSDLVALFVEMDSIALKTESARDQARLSGPDPLDSLRAVDCPVLVIVGRHDLPTLVEAADDLARKYR